MPLNRGQDIKKPHRSKGAKSDEGAQNANERCGLCGKSGVLAKTPCCGNLICDDADAYRIFSYARNSCYRNHTKYTLCSYHCNERHVGEWTNCGSCRNAFEAEMYVWYGGSEPQKVGQG